jgi:hypothetical protein
VRQGTKTGRSAPGQEGDREDYEQHEDANCGEYAVPTSEVGESSHIPSLVLFEVKSTLSVI